jgi:anti-sigma factor RsiW
MDCDGFVLASLDYINDRLDGETRGLIAAHLAICGECRGELAMLYRIKMEAAALMDGVPEAVTGAAFDRLPDAADELDSILGTPSLSMPVEIIRYALDYMREAVRVTKKYNALAVAHTL